MACALVSPAAPLSACFGLDLVCTSLPLSLSLFLSAKSAICDHTMANACISSVCIYDHTIANACISAVCICDHTMANAYISAVCICRLS